MWNTFSVCLSCSAKSATKAISLAFHNVSRALKSMCNTAVGIKNWKQLFSLRLAFTTQKKATHTAEMMSVLCFAIFWVVNASSGEKSCLQFSIPTGSGLGAEGGVSHRLKAMWTTMECKRDSFNGSLGGASETHWECVSHCIKGRLNTDTSPQNFWIPFLDTDLTGKFKKSAVANAIAIPWPLCFSCFVPLRRFRENLTKPFYLYLSRTCDSPGGTPSVISLASSRCEILKSFAPMVTDFSDKLFFNGALILKTVSNSCNIH